MTVFVYNSFLYANMLVHMKFLMKKDNISTGTHTLVLILKFCLNARQNLHINLHIDMAMLGILGCNS